MAQLLGQEDIGLAVDILVAGGLVAFPTETVYGLGADASNPAAVAKIFEAKGRPTGHPLIVHIATGADLGRFGKDVGPEAMKLAAAFWPGPLTLIVTRSERVVPETTGGRDTVGLRVPAHPLATQLLHAFGGGVAAPSANRFGSVSPTTAQHVMDDLGPSIDGVIDGGPSVIGVESTIVDVSTDSPTLLRPGGISSVEIEAVLGNPLIDGSAGPSKAPGMLASHYAPRATVELVDRVPSAIELDGSEGEKLGVIGPYEPDLSESEKLAVWALPADAAGYAASLYATLREADRAGVDRLLIVPPKTGDLLEAVLDRLRKAAGPR